MASASRSRSRTEKGRIVPPRHERNTYHVGSQWADCCVAQGAENHRFPQGSCLFVAGSTFCISISVGHTERVKNSSVIVANIDQGEFHRQNNEILNIPHSWKTLYRSAN